MPDPRARLLLRLLLLAPLLASCARKPSGEEAMVAIRAANPHVDTTTVMDTVWRDGPPWFSCAEVRAKLRRGADEPMVRDTLDNWRPLWEAGWMALRDTAAGPVTDPGWCQLAVHDSAAPQVSRWAPLEGDSLASGGRRRGWRLIAGTRKLVLLGGPDLVGKDSATVPYGVVVATNAGGAAVGAGRDTLRFTALLRRDGERWTMAAVLPPRDD